MKEFEISAVKATKNALLEYQCQKQNDSFYLIKKTTFLHTVIILVHNVMSLSKHVDDTVSDDRIRNKCIIGLTETEINPSVFTCKIIETLNF